MRKLHAVAALFAGLTLAGCASVSVFKVDPGTGKIAEGTPEGLRFYLPRPYISVFEPFIISSEVYIADGEMTPDSKYLLLTKVPTGLKEVVGNELVGVNGRAGMGDLRIDAKQVGVLQANRPAAPQAATAPASAASTSDAAASTPEAKKSEASGGILNYKATNDNNAFAVTPQPRYFNILWLPDFDEQYVVSAKAGLGNAGVVMGFGQGWSLQSLDATTDNSAIAKPLLDFYSGTLGALQKLAVAKVEGPLGLLSGKPQNAAATADSFKGGTPVSVKVTKVRIVAPGLYPILKRTETAQLSPEQRKRILEPVQPLTNIAFNTYDVIVMEAAQVTGDSALRIQQYVDSSGNKASSTPVQDSARVDKDVDLNPALKKLRSELSKPENVTTGKEYFTADMTRDATGAVIVTLTKSTGGPVGTLSALLDETALRTKVKSILATASVSVDDAHIAIKP